MSKTTTKNRTKTIRLATKQSDYDMGEIRNALEEIEANEWTAEDIDPSEIEDTDDEDDYTAAWDRLQAACKLMTFVSNGSDIEGFATAITQGEVATIRVMQIKTRQMVNVMPW